MTQFNDSSENISDSQPNIQYVERPWGSFKQYFHNQPVTVSLMTVTPEQRLSLQSHKGRAEFWIVLDAGAVVQIGNEIIHPAKGDELWIPTNTKHRLSSDGKTVQVLEVAFGNWQQDDITRYDDDYQRPEQGE